MGKLESVDWWAGELGGLPLAGRLENLIDSYEK